MSIKLDIAKPEMLKPKIAIFGVGGAGGIVLWIFYGLHQPGRQQHAESTGEETAHYGIGYFESGKGIGLCASLV